ncbi:MAG: EAL domain-containing protein [Burkholderiaceae bacterium]|nr:EAL domain-containing protein [Burkholderiaceae bacterium]
MSSIQSSPGSVQENPSTPGTTSKNDELARYQAERSLLLRQMAEQSRLLDEAKQRADLNELQAQALAELSSAIVLRVSNDGQTLEILGKHKEMPEPFKGLLTGVQNLPSTVLSERLVAIQGALRTQEVRTHIIKLPSLQGQKDQVFEEKLFPLSDSELLAVFRNISHPEDLKQTASANEMSPSHLGLPGVTALAEFIQNQLTEQQCVGIVMLQWQQAKAQAIHLAMDSPRDVLAPVIQQLASILQTPELITVSDASRYAIGLACKDSATLRSRAQAIMQHSISLAVQAAPLSVFVAAPEQGVTAPELLLSAQQQLKLLQNPLPADHYGALVPSLSQVQISNALKMGHLIARFQPLFGLSTGGKRFDLPLALEVLAALRQADGTVYFPSEFFRVLEASPLLHELNNQIITLGLKQLSAWGNQIPPTTRLVFNMTLAQLAHPGLPKYLLSSCETFRIDPARVLIDINESYLPYDKEALFYNSQSLHAHGLHFVLDNFGSTSIHPQWFEDIPVSVVKLSRQLISALGTSPEVAVRMRGLIQLAKSYNVSVLACGVQTEDQAVRIWEAGVIGAQGNLWASATEAENLQWN